MGSEVLKRRIAHEVVSPSESLVRGWEKGIAPGGRPSLSLPFADGTVFFVGNAAVAAHLLFKYEQLQPDALQEMSDLTPSSVRTLVRGVREGLAIARKPVEIEEENRKFYLHVVDEEDHSPSPKEVDSTYSKLSYVISNLHRGRKTVTVDDEAALTFHALLHQEPKASQLQSVGDERTVGPRGRIDVPEHKAAFEGDNLLSLERLHDLQDVLDEGKTGIYIEFDDNDRPDLIRPYQSDVKALWTIDLGGNPLADDFPPEENAAEPTVTTVAFKDLLWRQATMSVEEGLLIGGPEAQRLDPAELTVFQRGLLAPWRDDMELPKPLSPKKSRKANVYRNKVHKEATNIPFEDPFSADSTKTVSPYEVTAQVAASFTDTTIIPVVELVDEFPILDGAHRVVKNKPVYTVNLGEGRGDLVFRGQNAIVASLIGSRTEGTVVLRDEIAEALGVTEVKFIRGPITNVSALLRIAGVSLAEVETDFGPGYQILRYIDEDQASAVMTEAANFPEDVKDSNRSYSGHLQEYSVKGTNRPIRKGGGVKNYSRKGRRR